MVTHLENYRNAIAGFDTIVRSAGPDQWDNPSPCEAWTARDVVNHMVFMADMVAGMATGEPAVVDAPEGVPAPGVPDRVLRPELLAIVIGPLLGPDDDPAAVWTTHRGALFDALSDESALEAETMSPWGHTTTGDFLPMAGGDAVVHTWDLAVALGKDPGIDPDLAEAAMRAWVEAEATGSPVRQPAILHDPITSDATDPLARLLAFTGRRPL